MNEENKKRGKKRGKKKKKGSENEEKEVSERKKFALFHGVRIREKNLKQLEKWEKKRKTTTNEYFYKYWIVKRVHKKGKKNKDKNVEEEEDEGELEDFEPKENVSFLFTADPERVNSWIKEYIIDKNVTQIGIDTESDICKPFPGGGHAQTLVIDLLQICTNDSCVLFQTDEGFTPPPEELMTIMKEKKIKKFFCDSIADYGGIRRYFKFHGVSCFDYDVPEDCKRRRIWISEYIENEFGCINVDLNRKGLKRLCREYLNKRLNKSKTLTCSRWSSKELDQGQIEYAIKDALLPLLLHQNENCRVEEQRLYEEKMKQLNQKKKKEKEEVKEEDEKEEEEKKGEEKKENE